MGHVQHIRPRQLSAESAAIDAFVHEVNRQFDGRVTCAHFEPAQALAAKSYLLHGMFEDGLLPTSVEQLNQRAILTAARAVEDPGFLAQFRTRRAAVVGPDADIAEVMPLVARHAVDKAVDAYLQASTKGPSR